MPRPDPMLHPVRLRIVQALLGDRTLTPAELASELGDVPVGSLYRHIAALTSAGVLHVVAERPVRGTVERTYALRHDAAHIDPAEWQSMSVEDHANTFRAFVAGLLSSYDSYLESGAPDIARDGVGYSVLPLWLSDDEFAEFGEELRGLLLSCASNEPRSDRRRRLFAAITMPAEDAAPSETP